MAQEVTPKKEHFWEEAFLSVLAATGNVRLACHQVGISRTEAYRTRNENPTFAAAWEMALEDACDLLEFEARKRAQDQVNDAGEVIRAGSDTLLIFLLKVHRYKETLSVQHTGKDGGPIQHGTTVDLSNLSVEQLSALAKSLQD
jgi:hypothetical protein